MLPNPNPAILDGGRAPKPDGSESWNGDDGRRTTRGKQARPNPKGGVPDIPVATSFSRVSHVYRISNGNCPGHLGTLFPARWNAKVVASDAQAARSSRSTLSGKLERQSRRFRCAGRVVVLELSFRKAGTAHAPILGLPENLNPRVKVERESGKSRRFLS